MASDDFLNEFSCFTVLLNWTIIPGPLWVFMFPFSWTMSLFPNYGMIPFKIYICPRKKALGKGTDFTGL